MSIFHVLRNHTGFCTVQYIKKKIHSEIYTFLAQTYH